VVVTLQMRSGTLKGLVVGCAATAHTVATAYVAHVGAGATGSCSTAASRRAATPGREARGQGRVARRVRLGG